MNCGVLLVLDQEKLVPVVRVESDVTESCHTDIAIAIGWILSDRVIGAFHQQVTLCVEKLEMDRGLLGDGVHGVYRKDVPRSPLSIGTSKRMRRNRDFSAARRLAPRVPVEMRLQCWLCQYAAL
jgi:hypothetical protein